MQILNQHRAFFVFYFTFLLVSSYLLIIYSKASIHLYFNQFHTTFFDYTFKYLTYVGDGITVAIIGLLFLLFHSKRAGFLIWLSAAFSGLISQLMKHLIFGETPRPYKFFTEIKPYVLHYVENVDMNMVNSLPSGHTSSAFALCLSIAFIYKTRKMDTSMFILAFGIGVSRIYLSQHFLEDVVMGSMIGVLSAIVAYSLIFSPSNLAKNKGSKPLIKSKKNGFPQ
jgi:membrane-associated phospholipid phosphatase